MNKIIIASDSPRIASELIEIPISNGTAGRVNLPDVPQLRNQGDQVVVIKKIRCISPKVLKYGITTGEDAAPVTDLQLMVLCLYSQGWEKGHYIPLLTLNDSHDSDTGATSVPFRHSAPAFADWTNVDWNKSYLLIANGQTIGADVVVNLEVEYLKYQKSSDGTYNEIQG